jgi:hypothetical protein
MTRILQTPDPGSPGTATVAHPDRPHDAKYAGRGGMRSGFGGVVKSEILETRPPSPSTTRTAFFPEMHIAQQPD